MSNLKQRHDNRIPDMSNPSVKGLAYLLRHKEMWPPAFGPWNYGSASHCALGLMQHFWNVCDTRSFTAAVTLEIHPYRSAEIFCGISCGNVQPEDVAIELEALSC